MAEALKNQYGPKIPHTIASMISAVYPEFLATRFLQTVLNGYEDLELMQRARKIATGLRDYLPQDYAKATTILMNSLGERLVKTEGNGMSSFLYLPHCMFVSEYGVSNFELSMSLLYELTQRFTAEFSIRVFLQTYPDETLDRLRKWASDPSEHVRRLVSEGTRPRLPWASHLPEFQKNPQKPLELLELLKNDESEYVRRSVANHLNDIGKDHPDILLSVAGRWLKDAPLKRQKLIRHALRSLIKAGNPEALSLLGYAKDSKIRIVNPRVEPGRCFMGEEIGFSFHLVNTSNRPVSILLDYIVHYQKANQKLSPKVFKLKTLELGPLEKTEVFRVIKLANLTTRKHYSGLHRIEVLVNGHVHEIGQFELVL